MVVELKLLIICDDPAMWETGETYVMLRKKIRLPFAPFSGLLLRLKTTEPKARKTRERLQQAAARVTVRGCCEIQQVYYGPHRCSFDASCCEAFETIDEFHAALDVYKLRYGLQDWP